MAREQVLQNSGCVTGGTWMPKKTDAQALRTRQWLLEALVTLMREKPYAQITISELAGRAGVDRRTFYRHYQTKDEVLTGRIRELAAIYETVLRSRERMDTQSIALAFFTVCRQNAELLGLLHRHGLLVLLLYELNRLFPKFHSKYHTGEDLYAPYGMEYALTYHVGGFWNVLERWLADGMNRTPEELAAMIGHMLPEVI